MQVVMIMNASLPEAALLHSSLERKPLFSSLEIDHRINVTTLLITIFIPDIKL